MQIANVMVALGGDKGTTVPKPGVTVSEIAVLRAIHGNDAVTDIEPCGEIDRPDRVEIARLNEIYGRARGSDQNVEIVKNMFPGVAARAYRTIDELVDEEGQPIPEEFFKPIAHAKAEPVKAKAGKKTPKLEPAEPETDEKLFD
jgi:hypothetical protein